MEQVLTLPWWWQISEVVTVRFLLALEQVLTVPWWWQGSEVVPALSYFCWNKC